MERIIFCVFLGEDLDVYNHLLPRYFPSADKYDQELESIEQQEDVNQEQQEDANQEQQENANQEQKEDAKQEQQENANQEENAGEEKEKDELHKSEGEGKAAEKSDKEEETAGLFVRWTSKRCCFFLCALHVKGSSTVSSTVSKT